MKDTPSRLVKPRTWQRPPSPRHPWTLNEATSRRWGYPIHEPSPAELQAARIAEPEALTAGLGLLDTEARQ